MAIQLGRMATYLNEFLPIKSHDSLITWSFETTWQTTTSPLTIKLGRIVTYFDWLLSIKSHDHLITWSCKITWQTIIVPLVTKLGRIVTYLDRFLLIKSQNPLIKWSCEIMRQLKTLYLHYDSACGHQTWRANNLSWEASTHNVTLQFGHVVLRDHVTN